MTSQQYRLGKSEQSRNKRAVGKGHLIAENLRKVVQTSPPSITEVELAWMEYELRRLVHFACDLLLVDLTGTLSEISGATIGSGALLYWQQCPRGRSLEALRSLPWVSRRRALGLRNPDHDCASTRDLGLSSPRTVPSSWAPACPASRLEKSSSSSTTGRHMAAFLNLSQICPGWSDGGLGPRITSLGRAAVSRISASWILLLVRGL